MFAGADQTFPCKKLYQRDSGSIGEAPSEGETLDILLSWNYFVYWEILENLQTVELAISLRIAALARNFKAIGLLRRDQEIWQEKIGSKIGRYWTHQLSQNFIQKPNLAQRILEVLEVQSCSLGRCVCCVEQSWHAQGEPEPAGQKILGVLGALLGHFLAATSRTVYCCYDHC